MAKYTYVGQGNSAPAPRAPFTNTPEGRAAAERAFGASNAYYTGGVGASGSYETGNAQGVSQPKPIQNFAGGKYDPNTNTFTDVYGNKSSTNNPQALSNQIVEKQQKAELKAFSVTGGLVGVGQSSLGFKTSTRDIQTDSNAIQTAAQIADSKARVSQPRSTYTLTNGVLIDNRTGRQAKGVSDNTVYQTSSAGSFLNVGKGGTPIAATQEQVTAAQKRTDTTTSFFTTNLGTVLPQSKATPKLTVTTTQPREMAGGFKVVGNRSTPEISELGSGQIEPVTAMDFFNVFSLGVGSGIGFGTKFVSTGVQKVAPGLATKVSTKVIEPFVETTSRALIGVSDDVVRVLGQGSASQAGRVVIGGTTKAVSTGTKEAVRFAGSQAVSGTGYYVSTQAPETSRQFYDIQNLGQAQKFKQFETQSDFDKINKAFNDATVKTLGGKEKDAEGTVTDVASTVDPLTGFVYGAIPSTRLTNTQFVNAWETRLQAEYADDPRYKALSPSDQKQFIEYKKGKELTAAQVGGLIGQVGTEISSEIGGSGTSRAFFNRLSGGTKGGFIRQATTRAVIVSPYGALEGGSQPVTEASAERRVAETNEILFGAAAGVGTSTFFAGAPTLLRGTATKLTREAAQDVTKTSGKKSTKKAIEEAKKVVEKQADVKGKSTIARIGAGVIEVGGYVLDPLEKPGDLLAAYPKRGLGISTITLTADGRTSTSTKTKDKVVSKPKQPMSTRGATYDVATKTYTDANGRKQSMSLGNVPSDATIINSNIGGARVTGVTTPGDVPPVIPDPVIPTIPTDDITDDKSITDTTVGVPSFTTAETKSTIPTIVPQRFFMPGFFPIGSSGKAQARERTKFYDELSAAGKRFQQLSGLPFAQQQTTKRGTVLVNGKEYRLGKRVKKK